MATFFVLILVVSLISLPIGVIRPAVFRRLGIATAGRAAIIFGGAFIVSLVMLVSTAPNTPEFVAGAPTATPSYSPAAQSSGSLDTMPRTQSTPTQTPKQTSVATLYAVTKVVDGDTLAVNIDGITETIRLIGADTPETVDPRKPVQCYGIEASNKAKATLHGGKRVRLESDPTQGDRDKYDRLLRYVYLEDGILFNKMMISEGYAHEYTYNIPYKYQEEFNKAEDDARIAKRGLWADNACVATTITPIATTPPPSGSYSVPACVSSDCNCGDFSTHAYAQWFHDNYDPSDTHRLDADHDGIVCETLP